MTVREYIGARYVPLFMGEWDESADYEPLSIVQYQGNSYTSRQSVPAGIPLTNETYWAETGSYNAQIEAYRQEVARFNGRITANAQAIETETAAREALEGELSADIASETLARSKADSAINAKLTTLERDVIAATQGQGIYKYFQGYNAVIIGDSYSYGTGASDHLAGDTYRYSSILCSRLAATEFNFAVGSTGFCDPGSGGQNMPFANQIDKALNTMSKSEITNTHLVVIAGGVNDFNEGATYSYGDMRQAAANCCSKAAAGFPNALILVVPMLFKGANANPRLLNFENALSSGVNGESGNRRSVCIKGAWTWNFGMASHYISDELHPNDLGHRIIANRIYERILGGESYENRLLSISFESGYSGGVEIGGYLQFYNGVVQCYGAYVVGNFTANTTTLIGSIGGAGCPNQNATSVVTKSSNIVGTWMITGSGNIYVKTTQAVSDIYLAPISFIPKGVLK